MQSIEAEELSFSYGQKKEFRKVLDSISFTARGEESIGLIGANGVGKSTLLKLLVGLQTEYEGRLCINGMPVKQKNLSAIRKSTGYVFQDSQSQLFLSTVFQDAAFAPRNYGLLEEEVEKRVKKSLEKVQIPLLAQRPVYQLSGGEKKLAAIAGILTMEPDIILMDEPSAALDPRNRRNLIHILNGISGLKLIASHDLDLIFDTCERTILLAKGNIVTDGRTREILTDGALLEENGLELPLSLGRK